MVSLFGEGLKIEGSSSSISVKTESLDDWYEEKRKEDIQFSNTIFIDEEKLRKEFEGRCRKKISSKSNNPKPIETFRGMIFNQFWSEDWETYEGHLSELRTVICSNEEIISEFQMWDYHRTITVLRISMLFLIVGTDVGWVSKTNEGLILKPWKENNYDKLPKLERFWYR